MDNKEIKEKIDQLFNISINNTKNIESMSNMIYQQSVAINNLLNAYNQNALNTNGTISTTNSILKKMADMEIKSSNNDVTLQDISESISLLRDEIANLQIAIKEIDMYGGTQW